MATLSGLVDQPPTHTFWPCHVNFIWQMLLAWQSESMLHFLTFSFDLAMQTSESWKIMNDRGLQRTNQEG